MNKRATAQFWLEFTTDISCLALGNIFTYILFHVIFNKIQDYPFTEWVEYIVNIALSFIVVFVVFHSNIDIHKRNRLREFSSVLKNVSLTYAMFTTLMILTKNELLDSRYTFIFSYIFTVIFSSFGRYRLKRKITGSFTKSAAASIAGVIVTEDQAEEFVKGINEDWSLRISGIALLGDPSPLSGGGLATKAKAICDIPVVADETNYMDWIRSSPLDEVFVNLPYNNNDEIAEIVEELEDMGITVHVNLPIIYKMVNESKFNNLNCKMFSGYPMATFTAAAPDPRWMAVKRVFDIFFGIVGCILSAPIILITAIPLLAESPGPLFFKQQRVGKNGRLFNIYKLRSMYVDAEERKAALMAQNKMNGLMFKMDEDPRITKVGKFIRKYSIDELPQFINVLKGDMSLIGTRPPTVDEFEHYESRHKRRLSMRPGITGMWQVSGRSNINDFEKVVELDCQYIDNWSPMLDLKIFFKTIYVVLTHKGAE